MSDLALVGAFDDRISLPSPKSQVVTKQRGKWILGDKPVLRALGNPGCLASRPTDHLTPQPVSRASLLPLLLPHYSK